MNEIKTWKGFKDEVGVDVETVGKFFPKGGAGLNSNIFSSCLPSPGLPFSLPKTKGERKKREGEG